MGWGVLGGCVGGDERKMDVQRPENEREIIDAIIHFGMFSNES